MDVIIVCNSQGSCEDLTNAYVHNDTISCIAIFSFIFKNFTILDAWGWCTGTTQRDGMGREEGGGFRMGNTCIPVADSF